MLLWRRAGPFVLVIPCRIVYVVDQERCFGFAYGTLPGHPESGEERFVVEETEGGEALLRMTAFSRPDVLLDLASTAE